MNINKREICYETFFSLMTIMELAPTLSSNLDGSTIEFLHSLRPELSSRPGLSKGKIVRNRVNM